MRTETILGIGALIVIVCFVWFAFHQGMKLKSPDDGGGSGDHGFSPPPDSPAH
jgi:hypothetical protein